MEEIVALDSSKQKQFVKSIKGIKKKLVKKNQTLETKNTEADEIKDGKTKKRKIKERGLVYLAHIPHGFYENEMTQYFKQFGMVTNVRVIRSKRTGNSKGYAFIEFKEPTVAQIVAETMNNYLMGKRLLKAAYIPPEKQKQQALRKKWNPMHNPSRDEMIKQKKAYNSEKNELQHLKIARKTLSNINKTKEKLRELGIDYDFFTPVDVPEELLSSVTSKGKPDKPEKAARKEKDAEIFITKKEKKEKDIAKKDKNITKEPEKSAIKKDKTNIKDAKLKKVVQETKLNTKEQKQKEQKLKEKGVKPAVNFIKIQEDSGDDSVSSLEFDSDEYEKLMEEDDESLGSDEEASDSDEGLEDEGSDDEESGEESDEEEVPKMPLVMNPNKLKNLENKKNKNSQPQMKRTGVPVVSAPSKKSKFEKQQKSPQFAKTQFKKKK